MQELANVQGVGGLYFVGAYSLYSVPLLENGVASAMKVALRLGARVPWLDQENPVEISTEGDGKPLMAAGGSRKNDQFIWAGVGLDAWARSILGANCFCNASAEATPAFKALDQ
jgi:hypothetical protein